MTFLIQDDTSASNFNVKVYSPEIIYNRRSTISYFPTKITVMQNLVRYHKSSNIKSNDKLVRQCDQITKKKLT